LSRSPAGAASPLRLVLETINADQRTEALKADMALGLFSAIAEGCSWACSSFPAIDN